MLISGIFWGATVIFQAHREGTMAGWREFVEELDEDHRLMLEGGALSRMFLGYPMTICHPVFIGALYGILTSLTLILPFAYAGWMDSVAMNEIANEWGVMAIFVITISAILGGTSLLISQIMKRPPIRLENRRRYLFPFPFIGLVIITFSMVNDINPIITQIGWICAILPGPLYVHLSYAPRWRILDRIDRGLQPFEGMSRTIDPIPKNEEEQESDEQVDEVVDEV